MKKIMILFMLSWGMSVAAGFDEQIVTTDSSHTVSALTPAKDLHEEDENKDDKPSPTSQTSTVFWQYFGISFVAIKLLPRTLELYCHASNTFNTVFARALFKPSSPFFATTQFIGFPLCMSAIVASAHYLHHGNDFQKGISLAMTDIAGMLTLGLVVDTALVMIGVVK